MTNSISVPVHPNRADQTCWCVGQSALVEARPQAHTMVVSSLFDQFSRPDKHRERKIGWPADEPEHDRRTV